MDNRKKLLQEHVRHQGGSTLSSVLQSKEDVTPSWMTVLDMARSLVAPTPLSRRLMPILNELEKPCLALDKQNAAAEGVVIRPTPDKAPAVQALPPPEPGGPCTWRRILDCKRYQTACGGFFPSERLPQRCLKCGRPVVTG